MGWAEIRSAACELAQHGWAVLPGTYQLAEHGAWLGSPGAVTLEPIPGFGRASEPTTMAMAMEWWTRRPYSVLLACGAGINAVEVTATHGNRVLKELAGSAGGPVAVTPVGSWVFFVREDDVPLNPELVADAPGRWYASGSWIPLPPTRRDGLPYRWKVSPEATGWVLPTSSQLQSAFRTSLDGRAPS
ncbi:bifunctional DNA primase/polymerase [Saccharopolyspora endophytica]|uniref:Bifunctional DNA primase/polymerase n=1 Tax=Saccharopolyspora endophytica TaxID=543886 RepID=A0ABS5DQM7_9PSEU|nr:bifunctional DNA primase/polymerase [Saccharopolyspora endophytica]